MFNSYVSLPEGIMSRKDPNPLVSTELQLFQAFLQDESGPFTTWLCVACRLSNWLQSSWST